MAAREEDVGVTRFVVENHIGFFGTIKHRFRDFLVNEVDVHGKVVHLTSVEIPADGIAVNEDSNNLIDGGLAEIEKLLSRPVAVKVAKLLLGDSRLAKVEAITALAKEMEGDGESGKSAEKQDSHILLDEIKDKSVRTGLHRAVRTYFNDYLMTDTVLVKSDALGNREITKFDGLGTERVVRIILKLEPVQSSGKRKEPDNGGRRSGKNRKRTKLKHGVDQRSVQEKEEWPAERPPYLKFVLYKENVEMNQALNLIGKSISVRPSNFETAGIKDKRGVTVQHVTTYHVRAKEMFDATESTRNKLGKPAIVHVGNFEYVKEPLKLGMLGGNRFTVLFRDLQIRLPRKDLASLLATDGSQNHQLEGNPDEEVAVHAGNWSAESRVALKSITDKVKCWDRFLNYFGMQRFGTTSTSTHTIGLKLLKGDYLSAVKLICQARSNDSPILKEAVDEFLKTGQNASQLNRALPSDMVAFKAIALSLSHKGKGSKHESTPRTIDQYHLNDYAQAIKCIPLNLRSLYVNAFQSFVFNLAVSKRVEEYGCDRVIPGDLVLKNVSNALNNISNIQVATTKDIEEGKWSIEDVVLPLFGHKLIQYPTHKVNREFYEDILSQHGLDLSKLAEKGGMLAPRGSYRQLAIQPKDVTSDFIFYNERSRDEDLVLCDLDKMKGIQRPPSEVKDANRAALRLEFTLPAACYATMGFRELLRLPTDRISVAKPFVKYSPGEIDGDAMEEGEEGEQERSGG